MTKRNFTGFFVLLGVVFGLSTTSASAHHSGANFDMNQRYVFNGVVKTFLWANPHSWVYVLVPRANGVNELWGFELQGGTNMLRRKGWKSGDLKSGDKIRVVADIDRTGARIAQVEELTLPDGSIRSAWPNGPPPGFPKGATPKEYK